MPPYHGGGEMISKVWDDHSTYNRIPHKFEAGTPNVEGAVGLAAAIDYLERIGLEQIAEHEQALAKAAIRSEEHTSELQSRPHLVCRLLLEKKKKCHHKSPGP